MARQLAKGMGEAVAKRTVLRTIDGDLETWDDVAKRVALGNVSLISQEKENIAYKAHKV